MNVSYPAAPHTAGYIETPGPAYDVVLVGGQLLIADGSAGLRIASFRATPTKVASFDTWTAETVTVAGDHAYVGGYRGLHVVDVTDPTTPTEISSTDMAGQMVYVSSVMVTGTEAYVADPLVAFRILDILDPGDIHQIGAYRMRQPQGNGPSDLAVVGDRAYATFLNSDIAGLYVLDITNPAALTLLGDWRSEAPRDVAVDGLYAYVVDQATGLHVLDVSTGDPVEVGFCPIEFNSWYMGVAAGGGHAYACGSPIGLTVVDVSNPASPTEVGSYYFAQATDTWLTQNHAYVAAFDWGVTVLDISDPIKPTGVAGYDTPGFAQGIYLAGDYAYVADSTGGLVVLRVVSPRRLFLPLVLKQD